MSNSENGPSKWTPLTDRFRMTLGILKGARSQREFAEYCNISQSGLRKYLIGESTPTLQMVEDIAKSCGADPLWMVSPNNDTGRASEGLEQGKHDSFLDEIITHLSEAEKQALAKKILKVGITALLKE